MKKIFSYALMLVATMVAFTSCESDQDSNPTLVTPTEFTVNNPSVGDALVDLAKSQSVNLTWSQPQFTTMNAPLVVQYEVQLSTKGQFTTKYDDAADDNSAADYIALDETYTQCNVNVPAADIAKALEKLTMWDENNVPAEQKVSVRVRAFVRNASMETLSEVCSNVVSVNTVPYYVELKNADPIMWYLIGGDIADGAWGDAVPTSSLSMQPIKDYDYDKKTGEGEIEWIGYLGGNGFKLKASTSNWDNQVGSGASGYVLNDGGSGNITVSAPGIYRVVFNTKSAIGAAAGTAATLSVTAYDGNVTDYSTICLAGQFNDWSEKNTPMNAVHTYAGAQNHDWWLEFENPEGGEVKFTNGSLDVNWGVDAAGLRTFSTGDVYGWGVAGAGNIALPAGKYKVVFNDITGYYRFTAE